MTARTIGVLLMAYGTPTSVDDIEPYYTDIRRGRPPTPEALADLVARYAAIGGISPLARITEAQRGALQRGLDRTAGAGTYVVATGLKHADPKVDAAAHRLATSGVDGVVGLVLAPHYSSYSIGQYQERLTAGVDGAVPVSGIDSWATEPAFIEFLAHDVNRRVDAMTDSVGGPVRVLFTAHSLPQRIIDDGDPYPHELERTAALVAERVGLTAASEARPDDMATWSIAWQSAGRTPEPWIGPDILVAIDELAASGCRGVIVCACGFVADHLEVLYDLDIEAAQRASAAGIAFDRTASVNDDAQVFAALAARVVAAADSL